jgi:hypothetical protein
MREERVDRGIGGIFLQSLSSAVIRGSAAGKKRQPIRRPLSLKKAPVASD